MDDSVSAAARPSGQLVSAKLEILAVDIHSSDNGAWYRIPISPLEVDLMNLGAGVNEALARAQASAGVYDQVRLITADEGVATLQDAEGNASLAVLRVPSGTQTGIKIHVEGGISLDDCHVTSAQLMLDTANSFVITANGVTFKPVVRGEASAPQYSAAACTPPNDGDGDGSDNGDGTGGGDDGTGGGDDGTGGGDDGTGGGDDGTGGGDDGTGGNDDGGWVPVILT